MSADCHISNPSTNKPTPQTGTRSHSNSLNDINQKFKQLTDNVLPASPYLLSVPTEKPFRLGTRFVSNWAVGENKLFSPEEEKLQYMTFLSHQDEDNLLIAAGGWSDEKGNIMEEEDSPSFTKHPASLSTNARQGKQLKKKQKISLSDYKKKALEAPPPLPGAATANGKNGISATQKVTTLSQQIEKEEEQEQEQEKQGTPNKSKDHKLDIKRESSPPPTATASHSENNRRKYPASPPSRFDKNSNQAHSKSGHRRNSPPRKKLRLSTDTSQQTNKLTPKAKSTNPVVPDLLSPTLPSDSIGPSIPPLLSPTLPPDIEEELKLQEEPLRKLSTTSTSKKPNYSSSMDPKGTPTNSTSVGRNGSNPSPPSSSNDAKSTNTRNPKGHTPTVAKPKPSQGPRPSVDNKQQSPHAGEKKAPHQIPTSSVSSKGPTPASPSAAKAPRPTTPAKPRSMVKLKYGKQNRKRVEALLKFSTKRKPTPAKTSMKPKGLPESIIISKERESIRSSSSVSSKEAEKYDGPRTGNKRPKSSHHDESQGPAMKRQRSSSSMVPEKSQTPSLSSTNSTSIKRPPSTPHNLFLTPRKELKGTSMRRIGSEDSDMRTPTAGAGSLEKPASSKLSPPQSSESQAGRPRDPERRAWRDEYQKFVALGRELKHASQRYIAPKDGSSKDPNLSPEGEKLGAVIGVEAILCFTLAFIANNRIQALNRQCGDSTGWRSITPYWKVVRNMTAPFPHLHGLCLLLGAVSQEAIHSLDLERLAFSSLPGDHSPAPTPGSDGNTLTSEEIRRQRREFTELKNRLPESYKEAHRLWQDGSRELPDSAIAHHYANTWSQRSKTMVERGREQLKAGDYAGDYYLPLGATTSPIEAVRFGWSLLNEWSVSEGVGWKGRIPL